MGLFSALASQLPWEEDALPRIVDAALTAEASSIIGSGLPGVEDVAVGRAGEDGCANCRRRRSLFSSSRRLLAISPAESGVSLNTDGGAVDDVDAKEFSSESRL